MYYPTRRAKGLGGEEEAYAGIDKMVGDSKKDKFNRHVRLAF
jgi:hypothetical protein